MTQEGKKITRKHAFRAEVAITAPTVCLMFEPKGSTAAPSISSAVSFAIHACNPLAPGIDWFTLAGKPVTDFCVSQALAGITGKRFHSSVTLEPAEDAALDDLCVIIQDSFKGLTRAPYRNLCIALLLRATIAMRLGQLPKKPAEVLPVCGPSGDELKDAPAAFDPHALMNALENPLPVPISEKEAARMGGYFYEPELDEYPEPRLND